MCKQEKQQDDTFKHKNVLILLHENINNINKIQTFSNLYFKIQVYAAYKKSVLNIKIQKI